MKFSIKKRLKSFVHATRGILLFVLTTHNAWIQLLILIVAIYLGYHYSITRQDWISLIFAGGLVLVAEAFNTSIETHMNLTSPEEHPYARNTKDISAGAVLISAVTALIIGLLIFWPYFFKPTRPGTRYPNQNVATSRIYYQAPASVIRVGTTTNKVGTSTAKSASTTKATTTKP
jgi:diacylglycerol kinase (ATP)